MKNYIIVGIFIFILLIVGISINSKKTEYPETHEVINSELYTDNIKLQETDINLYLSQDDYKLSMYEPKNGCYIGAYVLSNNNLNYDMLEFEKSTGKKHGIYIYNLTLGNQFPKEWVLECIANMKTPLIVIHPNEGMIFNESFLYDIAQSFGELSVSMFVEFYPNAEKYNILPEEYKNFYVKAKEIFKIYSPNSAFIWSVNLDNVYSSEVYYPGDNYIDWVGLSIYEPIYKDGNKSENNIWPAIDFFYNIHQKSKPIMITQFGASHYSSIDHSYYIENAQININEFYTKIKEKYPRIKAINYMDFKGNENYKVSDNEKITHIYKSIIGNEYFKYDIQKNENQYNSEYFKSAFPICKSNENIYISDKALEYELNINVKQQISSGIVYKNITWYPLEIINDYKKYDINIQDSNIYIKAY